MPKEWILNSAMNRFQLNFKRNVGAVSEAIRKCSPKNLKEWEGYYFAQVRSRDHIADLGRKLYVKITEVIAAEVEDITEQDCIDYIFNLVIDRTYDGYTTEIRTIYGQLERQVGEKIEPAPDEWDRFYNVDFYIFANGYYMGIQVKPASGVSHIPQIFKERDLQAATHEAFCKKFGGRVFYVISVKDGASKKIYNEEIISEIRSEIDRLRALPPRPDSGL